LQKVTFSSQPVLKKWTTLEGLRETQSIPLHNIIVHNGKRHTLFSEQLK